MLCRLPALLCVSVMAAGCAGNSVADIPPFPSGSDAPASIKPLAAYDLDTPIQILAANPATAAIVRANIPGLLEDGNYPVFQSMSLKTVASLSSGRISANTLGTIAVQLRGVRIATASN